MSEDYKELLQKYELLAKQYESLKNQYLTVLDLAKKNSDAYEYCLSSLEREIAELKKKGTEQNECN